MVQPDFFLEEQNGGAKRTQSKRKIFSVKKKTLVKKKSVGLTQRAAETVIGAKSKKFTMKKGDSLTQIGLTALAKEIFGKETVEMLKKHNFSARDIWEMSSPTTQCNNTVGKIEYDKTQCWICGLTIKKDKGFSAECEHVLPVAQAAIFISLYNPHQISDELPYNISLEYGWAHNVCNQEKGQMSGILYKDEGLQPNEKDIKILLEKIYKSKRSKLFTEEIKKTYGTLDNFQQQRRAAISEKYSAIIKAFTGAPGNEIIMNLFIMAGYALLEHPEKVNPKLQEILYNKEALQVSLKLLNKERIKTIRDYLGLGENTDTISKKGNILLELEDTLLKRIQKNIGTKFGLYKSKISDLSSYTHSLDFLQRIYLKYGDLKKPANVKKMVDITSDFLTRKYFEKIYETTKDNPRYKSLNIVLNENIVHLNENIKANGVQPEELDDEFQIYSSGQTNPTVEEIKSMDRSVSREISNINMEAADALDFMKQAITEESVQPPSPNASKKSL